MKASHVQQLFDQARASLIGRISTARAKYDLHHFDGYEYDLTEKRFWWLNGGVRQLEASVIVVGSYSTHSQTWLWAWGNRDLDAVRAPEFERVREFGSRFEIRRLTEPAWQAHDDDGWAMTAMSAKLLGATCAYRCPISNGFLFLLLNDLRQVELPTG